MESFDYRCNFLVHDNVRLVAGLVAGMVHYAHNVFGGANAACQDIGSGEM